VRFFYGAPDAKAMTGRRATLWGFLAVMALLLASAAAVAATGGATDAGEKSAAQQATDTVLTLLGMAFLLWFVGNILTKHNYNTRGPKGEKLPPAQ
jgi:hypothetical protein